MFREEQINTFIEQAREASHFKGPHDEMYTDEFIETVLEEVDARESDLTAARVAIEKYLISSLIKDPHDVVLMRMYDSFKPIIQSVIDIEVKVHGAPKYVVSKANTDAAAWAIGAASETPIQSIKLPTDVAQEVMKYGFTTVTEPPVLPEELEEPKVDYRYSFFAELEVKEGEDQAKKEAEWANNFEKEKYFALIDECLLAATRPYQISKLLTDELRNYVLNHNSERTEELIDYEKNCYVPDSEDSSFEFLVIAREASLRSFFTLLQITGDNKEKFFEFVSKNEEKLRKQFDYMADFDLKDFQEGVLQLVAEILLWMYARLPIQDHFLFVIKIVFDFINEDQRKHFYSVLNDMAAYYDERKFFESSKNCYLLKDYLVDAHNVEDTDKVDPEKEKAYEEEKQKETMNSKNVPGIYFASE